MSLELAITDHAAAIRELAAAILAKAGSPAHAAAYQTAEHNKAMDKLVAAATIEQDVTKVETDAKAEQKKVMALVEADRKSAAKQAIEDALAKAKAGKEAANPAPVLEEDDPLGGGAPELDWDKDVRPALLAVGKDRDALVKLMAKYDVPKGGKAPVEKWADLLTEANAIVAERG